MLSGRSVLEIKNTKDPSPIKRERPLTFLTITLQSSSKSTNKKENENHLIKMNLYKEIGMPPLPKSEKKWAELLKNNTEIPTQPFKAEEKPLVENIDK